MKELFGDTTIKEKEIKETEEEVVDGDKTEEKDKKETFKRPVWMKQAKRHASKKPKKSAPKQTVKSAPVTPTVPTQNDVKKKEKEPKKKDDEGEDSDDASSDVSGSRSTSDGENDDRDKSSPDDDDDQWDKFQKRLQRRERLEGRSKSSHPVHCPFYPQEKQEYWWTYICDRKSQTLLATPAHVTGLVDTLEMQLRFTAPRWPGVYTFTCCLRSDSYLGMDQQHDMKLDVKEAAAIPTEHPQWELSDTDTDNNDQGGNESEFTTDDEVEEE
ncbi:Translocation protein SEC63 homolog [Eumeta japonica]|uniref:Translocation protein SEC63 homolog n=1 Tax=Eumeta variegata TaxID=151549 RepID=A0A4C1ZQP6_EUMVA|nr:Translocation protein SEC63 homolog [Eumeta japonica]